MKKQLTITALCVTAGLTSLPSFAAEADNPCGEVSIADMNWSTATFMAHVDQFILEHGYGCEVDLVPGDTVPTTASMVEKGRPDIAPELWTNASREALDKGVAEGRLAYAGESLSDGGEEGYFVPQYMVDKDPSLATIEGVIANAKLFENPEDPDTSAFYTCPSGWTCQITAGHIFDALKLEDANFVKVDPGSGGALAGTIAKAYDREKPWFGYYWGPTAVLGKYPMVKVDFGQGVDKAHYDSCITQEVCENPKPTMWPKITVQTVVTGDFSRRAPQAMAYLNARSYTNQQLNQLLVWMEDNQADGEVAMVEFMKTKPEIWTKWLDETTKEKVSAAVNAL